MSLVHRGAIIVACNVAMVATWEVSHSWFAQLMAAVGVLLVWRIALILSAHIVPRARRVAVVESASDSARRWPTVVWFVAALVGAAFVDGIWRGAFPVYEVNLLIVWGEVRLWLLRRDFVDVSLAAEAIDSHRGP